MIDSATQSAIDQENPWPGLESYTEAAQAYFHGRDEEISELQRRVNAQSLTVFFGESGLGKTSLLQAGLFPRLRPDAFLPVYVRLKFSADAPPLGQQVREQLAEAIKSAQLDNTVKLTDQPSLWRWLHLRNMELSDDFGRGVTPVLVFDQFEEIFTQGRNAGTGAVDAFISELGDLVENRVPSDLEDFLEEDPGRSARFDFRRSDYRVLISLREDYLPHLEGLRATIPSLMQNRMRLTRMNGQQALDAVLKPGATLVTRPVGVEIVRFVSGAHGDDFSHLEVTPPLLSLICRELNERRRALGEAQISSTLLEGNRGQILSKFYEQCIAGMPPAVRAFVEDELVTDSGTRESVTLERARRMLSEHGAPPVALEQLVNSRLLRIDDRFGVQRIELTHDVLTDVLMESRRTRREREEKEKLEAERRKAEEAARSERQRVRRLWGLSAGMALFAVVCLGLLLVTYFAKEEANRAREAAARERQKFFEPTVQLAYLSWQQGSIADVRQRLKDAQIAIAGKTSNSVPRDWPWRFVKGLVDLSDLGSVVGPLENGAIESLAFEPGSNGHIIAYGTSDGSIKLFDINKRQEVRSFTWNEPVSLGVEVYPEQDGSISITQVMPGSAAAGADLRRGDSIIGISRPDGTMQDLTKLNLDDAMKLLEGPTGSILHLEIRRQGSSQTQLIDVRRKTIVSRGALSDVGFLTFNEDGSALLSGDVDGQVLAWETGTGKGSKVKQFDSSITGMSYSPHDTYIGISVENDPTLYLYSSDFRFYTSIQTSNKKPICGFAFSPDGREVGIAFSSDKKSKAGGPNIEIDLLSLPDAKYKDSYLVPAPSCTGLQFNHDGSFLATIAGGLLGLIDLKNHFEPQPLMGQSYSVGFAFSPCGHYIAATDSDSAVNVWDATTGQLMLVLRGHNAAANAVAFSPDESTLVSGGWDRAVRAWDLRHQAVAPFRRVLSQAQPSTIAFSPDGRAIVAAYPRDMSPSVRIYDSATWVQLAQFPGNVSRVNFSPDGHLVPVPDDQGVIHICDVTTQQCSPATLKGHTAEVNSCEFSPNGRLLASASNDGSARIWNLSTRESRQLGDSANANMRGAVTAITFSPDGRLVATGSVDDRMVSVFDVGTGRRKWSKPIFFGYYALRFSPDSKLLVAGGVDGTVNLWRSDDGSVPSPGNPNSSMRHASVVLDATFTPDGRLLTVSGDRTIVLWDVAQQRKILQLDNNSGDITAAFSPDGLRLVTAGQQEYNYWDYRFWDSALFPGRPEHATATFYVARAETLQYFGKDEAAIHNFNQGLNLSSDDDSPTSNLSKAAILRGLCQSQAALGEWDAVLANINKALQTEPDDSGLRYSHAVLALRQGNRSGFKADLDYLSKEASRTQSPVDEVTAADLFALVPTSNAEKIQPLSAIQELKQSYRDYSIFNTYAQLVCRTEPPAQCITALKDSMALIPQNFSDSVIEPAGTPFDWVFMALAYGEEGNLKCAQKYLDYSRNHMARVASDPLYQDPKFTWNWVSKMVLDMLNSQAAQVIEHQASSPETGIVEGSSPGGCQKSSARPSEQPNC